MLPRVRSPELPQNQPWLNTEHPIYIKNLKGRVIILDFWTYCCINCLHILADLKYLEHKYQDNLTVIGVHSGKFSNEQEINNIRQAILRYDIEHPVIVDSGFKVWQDYAVKAWPTLVVIDPQGYCIGSFAGEGNRDILDNLISQVIKQHQEKGTVNFQQIHFSLEKQQQPLITPLAFPGKVLASNHDGKEYLFIADSGHHRIVVTNSNGEVIHIIGNGKAGLTDGDFTQAQFFSPQGMAFDVDSQNLYICDTGNHALRQVNLQSQKVETIAGTGEKSLKIHPQKGRALEIKLNSPWDLAKIGSSLFIAMAGSHQIWEMQLETGIIYTYAGTGAEASTDGLIVESTFAQPSGITTNSQELFVADSESSSIRGVGIDQNATVRTICGSGQLFGFGDVDGEGEQARLQHCLGIEYYQNYLWIADTYNHKIKRVNIKTGKCETILGDGISGFQDGKSSRFFEPSSLSASNYYLYIADTNNHAIRKVHLQTLSVETLEFLWLCAPDVCAPEIE